MNVATAARYLGSAICACWVMGCSRDDGGETSPAEVPKIEPGLHRKADQIILQTDQFSVGAGEEKYMCWTARVPDAVRVRSYSKAALPFLHHVVLTTTTTEEPEGIRECDALFQLSWRPLFAAGAGKVELAFPEHVAQPLEQDAQLLVQLHLLNSADQPVTDSAQIVMNLTDDETAEPVRFGVFGNTEVSLPPSQPSSLVTDCQIPATTRVVGFFPHMHMLGKSMTLELGPSADALQPVYGRDPYDFNEQTIDSTDMLLESGQHARFTCNYDNTRQETVTYGESTLNEMCFLITFVVGPTAGCFRGPIPAAGGGMPAASGGDAGSTAGCPNVGIMGTTLPGCCTPDGVCGIDASQFMSAGCVELGAAAAGAAQMGYPIQFPEPRACGQ